MTAPTAGRFKEFFHLFTCKKKCMIQFYSKGGRVRRIAEFCVSNMLGYDRGIPWALSKIQVDRRKISQSIGQNWCRFPWRMADSHGKPVHRRSNRCWAHQNGTTVRFVSAIQVKIHWSSPIPRHQWINCLKYILKAFIIFVSTQQAQTMIQMEMKIQWSTSTI